MMKLKIGLGILVLGILAGCGGDHDHGGHDHGHAHAAPHGGSLVMLGSHAAQVEIVVDAEQKKLVLYVLDGHAEHFLRIAQATVDLEVAYKGAKETIELKAVANAATGEKVGATSQFEAPLSWAFEGVKFDATIKEIEVRGTTYAGEAFSFPEGRH